MMYKSLLAGTALLAATGDVLGKTYSSVATCSVNSIATASAQSKSVAAIAVKRVNAALCYDGSEDDAWKSAKSAAYASATAFAEAMVHVSATCMTSGNAEFKINGRSFAYAQATGIAEAFAIAQANAKTCGKCEAAGQAVVQSFEHIFLEATAKLEPYFYGKGDGTSQVIESTLDLMTRAYQNVTVDAFALAIASARAEDEKCSGNAFAIVGAGEKDDLNVVGCRINLDAATDYVVIDSLAVAAANAGAKVCQGYKAYEAYNVESKALAEAYALAVTEVSSACFVKGKGYGCAMGKADIQKTATAVAKAFVVGYAEASSECFIGCSTKVEALVIAIGDVIAKAYSEIYFNRCIDTKFFIYEDTKSKLVHAVAPSVAKLLAGASAHKWGQCEAFVDPKAYIGPTTSTKYPGGSLPIKPTHPTHPTYPTHPAPTHPTKKPSYSPKRGSYKKGGRRGKQGGKRVIHRRGAKKGGRHGAKKGGRKGGAKRVNKIIRSKKGGRFVRGKKVIKRIIRRKD